MQISALKISDGFTVVMEKKSTLHSGSDPSTAFCFPSLVNKAAESTGKAQDQHCSAELHLGLESSWLGWGRESNITEIKNLPASPQEGKKAHGKPTDSQSYQEVQAQPGRSHLHHAKGKLLPRGARMWGQHGTWGTQLQVS